MAIHRVSVEDLAVDLLECVHGGLLVATDELPVDHGLHRVTVPQVGLELVEVVESRRPQELDVRVGHIAEAADVGRGREIVRAGRGAGEGGLGGSTQELTREHAWCRPRNVKRFVRGVGGW
jgi:hypothetical protein